MRSPRVAPSQKFVFEDVNGGSLATGDSVFVRATDGHYLRVEANVLRADGTTGDRQTFVVQGEEPGELGAGDRIYLQLAGQGLYLNAYGGGGYLLHTWFDATGVDANYRAAGLREDPARPGGGRQPVGSARLGPR